MRVTAVVVTSLAALSVLLGGCTESPDEQAPGQPNRPNIILVMTDDQGYGDVGSHDNPIVQTPQIDQLASESLRLTNFHVDPTCSPTRSALMSGKYSLRAGVWHTVMGRHMLSDHHYTLPEALRDAGYDTAMVGKWHLGDNYPFRPQDQGFDHVLIHGGGGVGQAPDYWGNTQFDDTYFLNGEARKYPGFVTDVWFDEAIDFVRNKGAGEQPFFLYVSTNAPHVPWRAPEEYIAPYRDLGLEDDMAHFYAMVTNLDDNLARLRAAMREAGVEDNTILIFMTDNGSSLAARSDGEPASWLSEESRAAIGEKVESLNSGMRAGKASTYDGGHRVPFFISWPDGDLGEARDIDDLAAHFDVLPTLLDLAGIDTDDIDTDGTSMGPALKEGAELPDRTLVVTNQRVLHPDPDRPYAVMQGSWRYVHAEQGGGVELFDVASDPGQTSNIIEQHPERSAAMAKAYEDWWQHATGAGTPTTRPVVGTNAENPMRISSHDWLAPSTSQVAWWPGFGDDKWGDGWIGKEENFQISPWALKIAESGNYRITLYLHDVPAQTVIPRKYVHLQLNDDINTQMLGDASTSASFEVALDEGDLDIRAWFDDTEDSSDKPLAAFYMYVERLPEEDYLAIHNSLSEAEKREKYGFEGSGIPDSPEMIALTEEWRAMNSSAAKQRGRDRFNENKFGMFIHWGVYSTQGGIWKGEKMEDGGKGPMVAEWIMRRKEIPRAEYAELAKGFDPQEFDADEWVSIAKAAGMQYIVITSKHHDGFALFDTDVSDFNIVDATPFGRDVIRELADASKRAGIDFGVYYSNALDWRDGGDSGMKDYGPGPGITPRRANFPNDWDPAPVSFDDYIANKSLPQVRELLANYDLSQIWFDTPAYIPPKHSIEFYKTVYDANPEILVNSRVGNGFGDIGIPGDNVIPDEASENTWEGIATTNNSWGYKSYDTDWKSPLETLYWLVANVSKGGNFLLNVGPDGLGRIPAESVENLTAVGDWLAVNGAAIYGSRPWIVDHEGPTDIQMKGTAHRGEGGIKFEFESSDFWFTRKDGSVYVIALERPEDGRISVQALHGQPVMDIRVLGQSDDVSWEEGAESVEIQLPAFADAGIGYALEVSLREDGGS